MRQVDTNEVDLARDEGARVGVGTAQQGRREGVRVDALGRPSLLNVGGDVPDTLRAVLGVPATDALT
jgi:hypothetical protein